MFFFTVPLVIILKYLVGEKVRKAMGYMPQHRILDSQKPVNPYSEIEENEERHEEVTDEEFEQYVSTLSKDQVNKLAFEVDKHTYPQRYEMVIKRMRELEG